MSKLGYPYQACLLILNIKILGLEWSEIRALAPRVPGVPGSIDQAYHARSSNDAYSSRGCGPKAAPKNHVVSAQNFDVRD